MKLFDSHCHLTDEKFNEDREELIAKLQSEGVEKIVTAGYSLESSKESIKLAREYTFMYTTIGISPNDIPESKEEIDKEIIELKELYNKDKKIMAVGEIGLDYHWNMENKELQKYAFIKQIELANELDLPIQIHTREAVMDTLEILKNNKVSNGGIFHCCPLNRELVREGLKLGFYISFAGPITFKNSRNAEEIIKMVPDDKFLVETDSPYLAPEPKRGTRNDPRNVKYIIEKIAKEKEKTFEEIEDISYVNAKRIFKIQ
ncbi:MAG TPA: TatD family hydrolase [Clostridiaceae bacterium]|jgi:hydrolase, tatD family|nr:TatD family hydrolase [Clostridia bacterium]HJJ12020.1 TatD family hydrolase [Clostridiaceae bacterium]